MALNAVDGEGLTQRVALGQKMRARVRETTMEGPSPALKLTAAQDGYADGFEEAGRAGVDIDGLYGVGALGRTEFHGGAEDHRQLVGEGHGVDAGQGLDALGDGVETYAGRGQQRCSRGSATG